MMYSRIKAKILGFELDRAEKIAGSPYHCPSVALQRSSGSCDEIDVLFMVTVKGAHQLS
jgi:hypothetical protein